MSKLSTNITLRISSMNNDAAAIIKEMVTRFPVDSTVYVYLKSGQQVPTRAKVVGHHVEASYTARSDGSSYGGVYPFINVEIESAKEFSRQRIRRIYIENVMTREAQ